ncbi:MAG TPA: hypothetical protein PLV19_10345 [Nitrosomonas sp.]|nr:hypothetical protein [Nitrosomonas sp.]HQX14551.1 hypothetical protein [Nitrosomonas sp.]HRB33548.1 hypothetical protein [Nitrosomonas sp.]HRB46449.1 hypothetical protein [Nitrosomonas sp.]HRB76527.1 hypothetical protein [Nitrosomonas sp.]
MAGTLLKERQISMLREEIEILMDERQSLLDAAGAAAVFVASLDSAKLPRSAHRAAKLLARFLNSLPDETLQDALEKVNGKSAH